MNKVNYPALTGIRALAAFMVYIHHYNPFTVDFFGQNIHDFVWAADDQFKHLSKLVRKGLTIHVYYKQKDAKSDSAWANILYAAEKVLPYIEKNFGAYPYPQYSFIQGGDGGMEYAMATLIKSKKPDVFRWHDSGDVQDLNHLQKIYEVCRLTPTKKHWMPTREAWIKDHLQDKPNNLVIRFSAPMVDQRAPASWPNSSEVVNSNASCPAPKQNNECRDCRQCWDASIKTVSYGKH